MAKRDGIINKIMASNAPAVILMTESDPEHIGFLSELFNFYRHNFYLCADYDSVESLSMELARRVYADDEEGYLKILQFKHCEFGVNKNNVILDCVLGKIASYNGDCLMVIDSLEKLGDKYDFASISFLISNCPRNLKLVLVSSALLNIDYTVFPCGCPKLFDSEDLPQNTWSIEDLASEKLTEEQLSFLTYVSGCGHVDAAFADEIFSGGSNLLNYLSKKYPAMIFKKGEDLFCFSRSLREELVAAMPAVARGSFSNVDPKLFLIEHLCDTVRPVKAMKLAMEAEDYLVLDGIIRRFIEDGKYSYFLVEFAKVLGDEPLKGGAEYFGVKLIAAFCRYYKKDYKRAASMAEEIISASEKNSVIEIRAHWIRYRCFYRQGQYRQAVEYARDLIADRVMKDDRVNVIDYENILFSLPDAIRKYGSFIDDIFFKVIEGTINVRNSREYWYPKALQAMAEACIELGNYGKANDYIEEIKSILPFYVLPYKLMTFRYYVGDMKATYELARRALDFTERAGKDKDLTELYFLLAKCEAYFNKYDEALFHIDKAIESASEDDPAKYLAIAYKAAAYAKTGKAERGLDLATLYMKYCETYAVKALPHLLCAKAYCLYRLGDKDEALLYANKCLSRSTVRSQTWYLSDAINIDILHGRDRLMDEDMAIAALLESCQKNGMISVIVDYYDCFRTILDYAERNNSAPEAVSAARELIAKKEAYNTSSARVAVKLMGNTSVTVDGAELIWKTRKAKELFLSYVIAGKNGLDRNYILSNFWNDYLYESALNNLKTTNNMIRNTLVEKNVEFRLRYGNGKYALEIEGLKCDHNDFVAALNAYDDNADTNEKTAKMRDILNKYNGGFATDAVHELFTDLAETYRDRIMVYALALVEELIKKGDLIGARRLNNDLRNVDKDEEYAAVISEQREKLNAIIERT